MSMNDLEIAIALQNGSLDSLDFYLEVTKTKQIMNDIIEIREKALRASNDGLLRLKIEQALAGDEPQ